LPVEWASTDEVLCVDLWCPVWVCGWAGLVLVGVATLLTPTDCPENSSKSIEVGLCLLLPPHSPPPPYHRCLLQRALSVSCIHGPQHNSGCVWSHAMQWACGGVQ
jgi:hypothetical protein